MCKLKIENEQQNWPKLYNAINNRDVSGIADNVHRKDEWGGLFSVLFSKTIYISKHCLWILIFFSCFMAFCLIT